MQLYKEEIMTQLLKAKKLFPELVITGSSYYLKGTLNIPPPLRPLYLKEILDRNFVTEFDQPPGHILYLDAGNIDRLNSEKVSKLALLLRGKRIHFTTISQKIIETLTYIQFFISVVGISEIVFETMSDCKFSCKFDRDYRLIHYEKLIGEEVAMCHEVFDLFLEEYLKDVK